MFKHVKPVVLKELLDIYVVVEKHDFKEIQDMAGRGENIPPAMMHHWHTIMDMKMATQRAWLDGSSRG